MHADGQRLDDLSGPMIDCAFIVRDTQGAGFLEKVKMRWPWHFVREHARTKAGSLSVAQPCGAKVHCHDGAVGEDCADLLVAEALLVAPKTGTALANAHRMQSTNYRKATGLQFCLLRHFSKPRLETKRVAHDR